VKSLYEKTIAFVLQYIDEQKLREGDQLPTEAKLSALAGVSLVTVRRALSELSSQAVVRREQGRGTFVARPRVKAETTKVGGLRNGLHLDARSRLQTRVLSCSARACTDEESKRLGLPGADPEVLLYSQHKYEARLRLREFALFQFGELWERLRESYGRANPRASVGFEQLDLELFKVNKLLAYRFDRNSVGAGKLP